MKYSGGTRSTRSTMSSRRTNNSVKAQSSNAPVRMDYHTYEKMGQTSQGRKEAHDIMVGIVKEKLNAVIASAPEANKGKLKQMLDKAYVEISSLGNRALFRDFAGAALDEKAFLKNVNSVTRGTYEEHTYYSVESMLHRDSYRTRKRK